MSWKSVLVVAAAGMTTLFVTVPRGCACSTKQMAYTAAMKSDLRTLVTVQQQQWARDSSFALAVDTAEFRPTTGVSVAIMHANRDGWSAIASHDLLKNRCLIYAGSRPTSIPDAWGGKPVEAELPACQEPQLK
jgi:hypothetical protein